MAKRVDSRDGGASRRLEEERRVPTITLWVIAGLVLACWGLGLYFVIHLF